MSERQAAVRTALITYFPMLIAVLSLLTSMYNGHLNNKFVDIIQRNVGRTEYMRACKEIIDAYFQVKFRVGLIGESTPATSATPVLARHSNCLTETFSTPPSVNVIGVLIVGSAGATVNVRGIAPTVTVVENVSTPPDAVLMVAVAVKFPGVE